MNSGINQQDVTEIQSTPPNKNRILKFFKCPWNIHKDRPYYIVCVYIYIYTYNIYTKYTHIYTQNIHTIYTQNIHNIYIYI